MAGLGDVVGVPVGVASLGGHAPVTRGYRHALAWALAIGLHLMLLALFTTVSLPTTTSAPSTTSSLDVVLVSRPAVAPDQARAIAETAQQAASLDAEPETAPEPATQAASAASSPGQASEQVPAPSPADTVDAVPEATESEVASEPEPASEAVSDPEPAAPAREPQHEAKASSLSGRELAANATASLREQDFTMSEPSVELADREQQAAREAAEARYVDAWTRRVQDFGNRFYPAPPDLDGQLRVRVVIDHQGKLLQAEVVQSSGHTELDQAALDTIRGAAPYRPFDSGMAGLDRLSISRVWRFGTGNEFGVR
ncbi:energy transducer TonB [Onishia niordana]|uniref:energy transducer TonB n=1 Tax=Onishia niordana TaxID=2508711 RepID=UPI00109F837B|nr:energy transducer TonB [Halomonas niordiana]